MTNPHYTTNNNTATGGTVVQFRGIRERTLQDQIKASEEGYTSVEQMAIDELATRLIALEKFVGLVDASEVAEQTGDES